MLLWLVLACKSVDPAPSDLDELTHFFYLEFDSEDEARLLDGIDNLQAAWDREGNIAGGVTGVDEAHREAVGMSPKADFSAIYGVFEIVERSGCSADELGELYLYDDQESLFPGKYDDYGRSYDGNQGCFRKGDCDRAEYEVSIAQNIIGKALDYEMVIQLRRLRDEQGDTAAVFVRSYMPSPARVGGDTDGPNGFDQTYQIEVLVPQKASRHIHHYAAWNSGRLVGFGPEAEDFWSQRYLSAVEDWNDSLDLLCGEDKNLWK